jgi:chromosome partitioning protein
MNRTTHAREVVDRTKEELTGFRFFSPIPEAVAVRDAIAAGVPVSEHQPESPAAVAYRQLAKEVVS